MNVTHAYIALCIIYILFSFKEGVFSISGALYLAAAAAYGLLYHEHSKEHGAIAGGFHGAKGW
jgi:hypothetical protein